MYALSTRRHPVKLVSSGFHDLTIEYIICRMKICWKCGNERDGEDFHWKSKPKGIRHTTCKDCMIAYRMAYYERNKETEKARIAKDVKIRLAKYKGILWGIKSTSGCSRCPEKDPACLDFHHTDPKTKSFTLAGIRQRSPSLKLLMAEIEKCEVICANCHRKEHHYGSIAQT